MSLQALADDMEAFVAYLDDLHAAQSVCVAVASHRDTKPKDAAAAWLLGHWLGELDATSVVSTLARAA